MNNQGNFPNMGMTPTQNAGQMAGQNPMLNMFQNNLQGMNQQQRALFFENFQRNFQMMQQQGNSGLAFQQQGMMGNMGNPGLHHQMIQEIMRLQGNFLPQGMMGQSQGITGGGNFPGQGMMEQSLGTTGSGNSQAQGMMGLFQGLAGSGNSQAQGMMGQSQGAMGNGNSQIMGMQPGMHMQQGSEHSFSGNQNTYNLKNIQQSMGDHQTPVEQRQQLISGDHASVDHRQGVPQPSGVDKNLIQGLTKNTNNMPSVTQGHSLPVSKSPFVYTTSTGQTSSSNKSKQNLNQSPKLKSILKSTKSVSATQSANATQSTSVTQSAKISSVEKQTFSSVQQNAEKLKEMLSTYLYAADDDNTSSKDPVKKQTGTLPGNKGQTVHTSTSTKSKNSPFPAGSVASNSTQPVNVRNSRTTTSIKNQIDRVTKVSSSQSKSSHVTSQSTQRSKVEGRSIPTLVSSGSRSHKDISGKRKADVTTAQQVKKSKVTDIEDDDPEYVQAQVFISNIPNDTSKGMILDILRHYNFTSPQVWMGRHNTSKDNICAFVKLPSLKDSKRVITEMKGFPYKGKEMEIRFSAAADFMDYTVANDGMLQPPNSSQISVTHSAPPTDTKVPAPSVRHPIPDSAIPVETVPTVPPYPPVIHSLDNIPVFTPVVHTVYHAVPQSSQEIIGGYGEPAADRLYGDRDGYARKDTDIYSEGSYHREYRRSVSPLDRRDYSPHYSSHRDKHDSPHGSLDWDRRMSPEYGSRGRPSSLVYSPHRRYSRSPDYSPNRLSYRRSRSRSPYRQDPHLDALPSDRNISREYTSGHYGSEKYPLDDKYSMRDSKTYDDFHDDRGRRSSLSPDRRYRDDAFRDSDMPGHSAPEIFCVHIEGLPFDIKDSELESLLQPFLYKNVSLKVRDGKASANVEVASITDAKIMMRQLDRCRFMGSMLQVDWFRESSNRERDDRFGVIDDREHSRSFERERLKRSSERERSQRSSERERSRRSPERERSQRSSERERSRRSPEREKSRRSPERERSQRSPFRDRSRRSPGRDVGERNEETVKHDWSKGTRKSFFQSYVDASYPNAPILGRKYIKEFTSSDCNSAYYLCILCEVTLSWKEIADHMMGYKHRLKSIKRSHPKIYDKICLIRDKVDMLGQCAKYALELENKQEKVVWVDTKQPEVTATQHLKKLQGDKASEIERKETKKDKEDRKKKEEKKDEKSSDTTSDIFKKIEAYKKKFEARKDDSKSEESPAKRARKAVETKPASGLSFEDLSKQNKALADTIQKGITSARKGAEHKKNQALTLSRKQTPVKKAPLSSTVKVISTKSTADKGKNDSKKLSQGPGKSKIGKEEKVSGKVHDLRKEIAEKPKSDVIIVNKAESNLKTQSKEKVKEVGDSEIDVSAKVVATGKKIEETKSDDKKDKKPDKEGGKVSENNESKTDKDKNKKINNRTDKINEKTKTINVKMKKVIVGTEEFKDGNKKTNDGNKKTNDETKKNNEETKKIDDGNNKVNEETKKINEETKKIDDGNNKVNEETKKVSVKTEEINNGTKKTNDESKTVNEKTKEIHEESKKINEETEKINDKTKAPDTSNEDAEDLTIAPEDIADLGKSISAELFSEELGDMEEEDEDDVAEVVEEEQQGPVKRKFSNHPLSKIEKYFEVQNLKDPEGSGIVGLQYIVEGIPQKAGKAHMYRCTLCNVRCATASIVDHILGYKHRMKYFEVHNFDIYTSIVKMDQSRKFLNAECSKHAKAIEEKEGLKTVMSLTEQEFKQREKTLNKERDEATRMQKAGTTAAAAAAAGPTSLTNDKKGEPVSTTVDKAENKSEVKSQLPTEQKKVEEQQSVQAKKPVNLAARIKEAKEAAKLVNFINGKETVELYKYIQHKPDVPLLGLNSVTEIQGLYGKKSKSATYLCQLCCPFTKIDGTASIYEHLTGIKHMENYLKKHFPHKMIHLKLLTASSAKTSYLHNQAKLLCQGQLKQLESIYVVNIAQMEAEKAELELAKAAAKAVEEAAEAEKKALAKAQQIAMETAKASAKKISEPSKNISSIEVIDLTGEDVSYETPVAYLYTRLAGLEDIPLVGLGYIVEVHGADGTDAPLRYECQLCENDLILPNYINAHITDTDHRMKFLKTNYPVFYNRALGNRDETEKLCREIEQQFGRESVSVKKKIHVKSDGSVQYSDPVVVKAPIQTPKTDIHKEKASAVEKIETVDKETKKDLEEGEQPADEIVFNKIIEGLECTPMLGLQYIREVHHPTINIPPVYECDVCNIKNGPYLKTKSILKHICSKDHRLHFIRENHFHLYSEILALSTDEQRKMAIDKHTKEIESKVGRGSITRVTSDRPVYWTKSNLSTSLQESQALETSQSEDGNQVADENQPQYKCKKCSMVLAKDRRIGHIIAMHMSCFKCKPCQLSFPDHLYLQKHMTLVHKSKQVAPNAKLNQQFKMIKWFMWHSVRGKPFPNDITGRLQLVCKECNRVVPLGQAEHHYIVDHVKGYLCKECNTAHISNVALETHLQKQHKITESVPVVHYTANVDLSKRYVHVYSSQPIEVIDLTDSTEGKPKIGIKKFMCIRCRTSFFIDGDTAESHYKQCHFFEYPCSMCNYVFRVAVHLEKHYKTAHHVYRSVKTPVISFESCFNVVLEKGNRMLLDAYLKEEKISWKELISTLKQAPATSTSTPSVVAITTTTSTTTTIITAANQQAGYYLQNQTGQSSTSDSGTYKVGPDGLINLDEILATKEDPSFIWDTEYAKLRRRMEIGGVTNCARKSKFMMNYTSTFSNYPLVGLQMMIELQKKDISAEPWYICELCQERSNWKTISPHIVSLKHRILYLQKNHPDLHTMLTVKGYDTIEGLVSKVETLSQAVVKKEGEEFSMTIMIELPPSEKEIKMLTEEQSLLAQGTEVLRKTDLTAADQM